MGEEPKMDWIEVVPAYGRDYKNQKQVMEDWNADKDFRDTASGQYINKSGAERLGLKVIVRYAKLLKVMDVSSKRR
jgi:hypothetical protein